MDLSGEPSFIARGLGRSYGDASLNDGGGTLLFTRLNRFLSFDEQTGLLHAEAGVSLDDILKIFVPKGWFLPVTPGTKFITLGGAVASDVHGKNHHADGSISNFITELELITAVDGRIRCSRDENDNLFWATLSGGGLTGIILSVKLRLLPIETAYINQHNIKAQNVNQAFDIFDQHDQDYKYSVAWIDCLAGGKALGRSIVMFGNHAAETDLADKGDHLRIHHDPKLSVPFQFPSFALNSWSARTFNQLYYHKSLSMEKKFLSHYDAFFYPLDAIHSWNRIYGKKGFLQWQCALPEKNGRDGIKEILTKIQQAKRGSFLAVLKKMGGQEGLLNFPVKGYTLALDFSLTKNVHDFLDRLDEIVTKFGGRIYLTKDARLQRGNLAKMYPDIEKWKAIKKEADPKNRFSSLQADRLGLLN